MRPAAVLTVLMLVPGIQAAEPDATWKNADRDVEAEQSAGLFQATSRGPGTDTISVTFSPDQCLLRYALVDAEAPAALEMDTEVVAVTEWRDDGDGQYGPRDETVRRIEVQDLDPTMSVTPFADGYRVETVYTIVASTSDEDPLGDGQLPAGRLIIDLYVLGSATNISGRTVQPVDVPVRIAVEDFPYEREDTRLAFEVEVGAQQGLSTDGAAPVHIDETPYRLQYQWSPQAQADGAAVGTSATQMLRSPQVDTTAATLLFAFPRASDLSQDTTIGATRFAPEGTIQIPELPIDGDVTVFTAAALGAVAAVGVPAWVRLRGGRP